MMNIAVPVNFHVQPLRERVYHRRTHTVKTAAGLVDRIVKLSTRMERGEDQARRGDTLLVHPHGNSPSVVLHRGRTVRLQSHINGIAFPRQMLVHGIVHDLVDQMVEPFSGDAADVHARTFPDGLQPLQDRNTALVIHILFCHE